MYRVQRFLQIVSAGPLVVVKFNSKTIYTIRFSFFEPFRPRLTSKFAKSTNMINKLFSKKTIGVLKNKEFDADFEFVEKVAKNHAKKVISEKVTEKWSE
jgi:hypothetical protein